MQKDREMRNKKEMQRMNQEIWRKQIAQRNQADAIAKESEYVRDPHSLWTIETATRGIEERAKTKKTNDNVKQTLDYQVQCMAKERQQIKDEDLGLGQRLIDDDLTKTTREAQLAAFKRHEMTKVLREAWTQQQQMKDNAKKVDSIFY